MTGNPHASKQSRKLLKCMLIVSASFEQANGRYKYAGGTSFLETLTVGTKYAEFMHRMSEKANAAVSVKYLLPGEELDPDGLISVTDDADLQVGVFPLMTHPRKAVEWRHRGRLLWEISCICLCVVSSGFRVWCSG